MYEPSPVRFTQRAAHLAQQVTHARRWLGTILVDELSQREAWQEFHYVVQRSVGRAAVVKNVDRVHVR